MRWSVLVGWCQRGAAVGRQHSLQAVLALSVMMAASVAPTRLVGWSAAAGATANDTTQVSDAGRSQNRRYRRYRLLAAVCSTPCLAPPSCG